MLRRGTTDELSKTTVSAKLVVKVKQQTPRAEVELKLN